MILSKILVGGTNKSHSLFLKPKILVLQNANKKISPMKKMTNFSVLDALTSMSSSEIRDTAEYKHVNVRNMDRLDK